MSSISRPLRTQDAESAVSNGEHLPTVFAPDGAAVQGLPLARLPDVLEDRPIRFKRPVRARAARVAAREPDIGDSTVAHANDLGFRPAQPVKS